MSANITKSLPWASVDSQPGDVRGLTEFERDALIISAVKVDGQWIIRSRYGDETWHTEGFSTNSSPTKKMLKFKSVPSAFREVMKAIMFRYIRRGRRGVGRPKGQATYKLFTQATLFLRYLDTLKLQRLSEVTAMVCATYVDACKAHLQPFRAAGKPLTSRGLQDRFTPVEALYELSQYTDDSMSQHPWAETSAMAIAGLTGKGAPRLHAGKTPLIPDDVFCTLFERAYQQVMRGEQLLDIRDALDSSAAERKSIPAYLISRAKSRELEFLGWETGLNAYNKALNDLRTACYIVLASTSGCRNHELANVQSGAHHRTEDDDGTLYHWMRSQSDKTDTGVHNWMIPEAAVRALRLMERWSAPYQAMIAAEIHHRRQANPYDPQITEAYKHRRALFVGVNSRSAPNQVRTLTGHSWNSNLRTFVKDCGLTWNLASHQFRRKFANYAAHSRFGDLRYLKEHYAHWTLDMSLGYAMDDNWGQHLDLELYADIQGELEDIKLGVVDSWLGDRPLAGGYGRAIKQWQREPENLLIFKDHSSMLRSISDSTSIRSNGHAWCTADDGGCVGNTLERTRCGANCNNAVIDRSHAPIYQRLYDDLKELLHLPDIGEGGRRRVERDLNRCHDVLVQLGMDSETITA